MTRGEQWDFELVTTVDNCLSAATFVWGFASGSNLREYNTGKFNRTPARLENVCRSRT